MIETLSRSLLGTSIRKKRIEERISQEELAEKIGITPTHIKHIESGHRKPSVEVLYRVVRTLNMSLDDLFFPEKNGGLEDYRKAERLLHRCDAKQLRVLYATMEALLADN